LDKVKMMGAVVLTAAMAAGAAPPANPSPAASAPGQTVAPVQTLAPVQAASVDRPDITDFPQRLAGEIPDAAARKTYTRMMLWRATADLSNTFTRMRFEFEHSSDQKELIAQEQDAFSAYQSARNAVLARLATDTDYQAVVELRDELDRRITDLQKIEGITPDSIAPLAEEKMNYARTASAMEAKALAQDPQVDAAREQFVAAGTRLAQARRDFDEQLHYHPAVEAARTNVADAKVAAATSAAYSNTLVRVSNVAMNYAYFLHRHSQPAVIYSAYDGGYDYGYNQTRTMIPYRYYGYGYSR
jgi:hypothetical protein